MENEFKFNTDIKQRDEILFGKYEPDEYRGGTRNFWNVKQEVIIELFEKGFINPHDTQNKSPEMQELINFVKRRKGYTFEGYAVDIKRDDYRITLEGLKKTGGINDNERRKFFDKFVYTEDHVANSYEVSKERLFAWWD